MSEIWKNVVGYNGLYEISNLGNLRKKLVGIGRYRQIKPQKERDKGYLRVALTKEYKGKPKNHRIHRLVCEAFLENPNNYPQVNHKNGIKTDNRVENLEWCDNSMNQRHAFEHGLKPRHVAPRHKKKTVLISEIDGSKKCFDMLKDALAFVGLKGPGDISLRRKRNMPIRGYYFVIG